LLQNADDVGATEASVRILDGEFVFSHNGEDFTEEHFASLCRFGYSNKRTLHTIGFRGIGFKSIFSLGDQVHLITPTLSVAFCRKRFAEPIWLERDGPRPDCTTVRVRVADEFRLREVEENLRDWKHSPTSLLFFRNIRRFRVAAEDVHWQADGPGPVNSSEWIRLSAAPKDRWLIIRSQEEDFPAEALAEIKQERMVSFEEEQFPACQIQIVLGMEGRLFVVLPTGVKTALPFACNAPFIQDPARLKIKNPEISPTNRWLLRRVGNLAAETTLSWLARSDMSLGERAAAYQLLPDVNRLDNTLEGSCATIVETAFEKRIQGFPFLLGEEGELAAWQKSTAIPHVLLDVWSPGQVKTCFLAADRSILCNEIQTTDRRKLLKWKAVSELGDNDVLTALEAKHPPTPSSWAQLLSLWSYLAAHVAPTWGGGHTRVRILPAEGTNVLHAASEVVRIGDKNPLRSNEDWEFIAKFLLALSKDWLQFLDEQRDRAGQLQDSRLGEQVASADKVLRALGLATATDSSKVIESVAAKLFSSACPIADFVRLAQISAALGAKAPANFEFVSGNGHRLKAGSGILLDKLSDLDCFVTSAWYSEHVLYSGYQSRFSSCTKDEWETWIKSGRASVDTFVPLRQADDNKWTQNDVTDLLRKRGCTATCTISRGDSVRIEDWDFGREHWLEWRRRAASDPSFWSQLVERILTEPAAYRSKALSARAILVSKGKRGAISERTLIEDLCPAWIARLRELPCLKDTWGRFRQPAELLRRTPSTEAFLSVEPFVRAELDTEENRPFLVRLGVRDTPAGPESILECLRALTAVENPPIQEISKWYQRLDQLADGCTTADLQALKEAFGRDRLILTEKGAWAGTSEVFLAPDEDAMPGSLVVHPSVKHLALWSKVGVAPQPSAELAIAWLKGIPCWETLPHDELRRVKSLLSRYPERVWTECERWLNMEGQWVPVTDLRYRITTRSVLWEHLFSEVKQRTADLKMLRSEVWQKAPFCERPSLADLVEEHLEREPDNVLPQTKPWLASLGQDLSRVILEDPAETQRIRRLAERLAATQFQFAPALETVPYLAGVPAGTPRRIDALWSGLTLYVAQQSAAKAAAPVAQEIGGAFGRREIVDACKLCYERAPEFVCDYLQANFTLEAPTELEPEIEPEIPREPAPQADSELSQTGLQAEAQVSAEPEATQPNDLSILGMLEAATTGQEHVPSEQEAPPSLTDEDAETPRASVPPQPRPIRPSPGPSLMERFAQARGFLSDGPNRFYHPDGRSIQKVRDGSFPWELYSRSGEIVCRYWTKDHCLELLPLELEAEIWAQCDRQPDQHSLILTTPSGAPLEIPGTMLKEMRASGRLSLHAATYRLVLKDKAGSDAE
jgi:hypothetical protein